MNRLVIENPWEIRPEQLPGAERDGRCRLLFVTNYALGFKTLSRQLESYTATRDDIDAVHLHIVLPKSLRALAKMAPRLRGWDCNTYRRMLVWQRHLTSIMRTRLPADRFDAALVTTQLLAGGMPRTKERTGLPFAVYVDTTSAQYVREYGLSMIPEWPAVRSECRIFQSADFVAGMSRWSLDGVRQDAGIDQSRLLVVRNSVPVPAEFHERPAREGQKVRLAIVGNDWVRKGGDRIVAWHQARWRACAELHVFGANVPIDRSLEGIIWHGATEHKRLMEELLPSMDVFVLPTRGDMSPWVVVEAAGRGLPVVSTRIGALGEIVEDGRTGFLCTQSEDADYVAAIERLMADPALRTSMGRAAHRKMRTEFLPEREYGALVDRLKEVGSRRAAGAAR